MRDLDFRSDGFPATAEILGLLLLAGARVVEVAEHALTARTEGASKMRVLRTTWGHLGVMTRLLVRRWFRSPATRDGVTRP